jgi:hypothetical protein
MVSNYKEEKRIYERNGGINLATGKAGEVGYINPREFEVNCAAQNDSTQPVSAVIGRIKGHDKWLYWTKTELSQCMGANNAIALIVAYHEMVGSNAENLVPATRVWDYELVNGWKRRIARQHSGKQHEEEQPEQTEEETEEDEAYEEADEEI